MINRETPIVAGILVGGKSTRMGRDKATLAWGRSTIVEAIADVAQRVADRCVLLGAHSPLPAALGDWPRLADSYAHVGPIAGLHALLAHHPGCWCLLLSCDIPNITTETIRRLLDALSPDVRVVAYESNGRAARAVNDRDVTNERDDAYSDLRAPREIEPCCALYHSAVLPDVERAIRNGHYALGELIVTVPHRLIPTCDPKFNELRNINTPEDYTP